MNIQPSNNLTFQAGMTKAMKKDIASVDVAKISKYLEKQGIQNDFKNNKVVAWCVLKTFELLKPLKMGLPKGVFVENFQKLRVSGNESAVGLVNLLPSNLYKERDDIIVPETVVVFNEDAQCITKPGESYWNNLDEETDAVFFLDETPTDFFLYPFFHEFSHVMHENNLMNKLSEKKFVKTLIKHLDPDNYFDFVSKYGKLTKLICSYARDNFMETIACDLGKRLSDNLDKSSLTLDKNFIALTPYYDKFPKQKLNELDCMLRNFWNGKV